MGACPGLLVRPSLSIPCSLELGKALLGHVRRFGFWIRLYDVLKRPAGRFDIHEFNLAIGRGQQRVGCAQMAGLGRRERPEIDLSIQIVVLGVLDIAQPKQRRRLVSALGVMLDESRKATLRLSNVAS